MALSLNRLNSRQREAVLHGEGPLLILAGAGSGKTSTMTYRIAHLIAERKVPGTAILGLSFTNKAARELRDRVRAMLATAGVTSAGQGVTITTFHSLCVRLLRRDAVKLGFQPGFSIADESDQQDILKDVFRRVNIDDRKFDLDVVRFQIGQAKSQLLSPEAAAAWFFDDRRKLSPAYAEACAAAFPQYQDQLRALNAMDFDDLLYLGVRLLRDADAVRAHYNERFRHILVDEYQDTNPTQFELLRLLTQKRQNLCVVGDDDQSIYSWRGADSAHILEFAHQFAGARTITLDQNYRSTAKILDAANRVISQNAKRHPKQLWSDKGEGHLLTEIITEDDRAEAEVVATEIETRSREQNRPWGHFAVLYRSNAQSRTFEEALRRHRIPYKIVGGMSFLDRKEVKDTLSYWRVIANARDDASLRRIVNWPARGIGRTTIEAVGNAAFARGQPFFEAMGDPALPTGKTAAAIAGFRQLITGLQAELAATPATAAGLAEWARASLTKVGIKRGLEEECRDDPALLARRLENVEELVHSIGQLEIDAAEWDRPPTPAELLQDFLQRMTLDVQEREESEEKNEKDDPVHQVTLLTLHGAKGLEFPIVFMVGMEEGFLPHRRTIEEALDYSEERRLCYVGITRAKEKLFLTRARHRIRYGKPVPRTRSRFIEEIPKELLETEDRSHGPDASDSAEAREKHETAVKNHLAGIKALLART